jgi:hypothetical protein
MKSRLRQGNEATLNIYSVGYVYHYKFRISVADKTVHPLQIHKNSSRSNLLRVHNEMPNSY